MHTPHADLTIAFIATVFASKSLFYHYFFFFQTDSVRYFFNNIDRVKEKVGKCHGTRLDLNPVFCFEYNRNTKKLK